MEGGSPDRESVESGTRKSSISYGSTTHDRKEFLRRFVDSKVFTSNLENWFEEVASYKSPVFDVPFELIDLQKFDYALEGVPFQQLIRMPSAIYASTSAAVEATAYLALEDFLHTSVKCLWEAFWGEDEPLPFYVSCLHSTNLRFYQAEKAIAKGRFKGLCAATVMYKNPRHPQGKWDDVLQLALLRPDIGSIASLDNGHTPSYSIIGEALFYALRVLLARNLKRRSNAPSDLTSVSVLLVDSQYGGVMKIEGDVNKLEIDVNNVYECAADWVKNHSTITISPVDRIWNKLGNANWGDIGALQLLFSTFHSIVQYAGMPRNTIEDLAADHSARLQARRIERHLGDSSMVNGTGMFRFQNRNASPEIVEVQEESIKLDTDERSMKLEAGFVLWMEDSESRRGYQINEVLTDGEIPYYVASSLEEPERPLFLYVGSHPSQLEPVWEDMKLWYQVQRQTKVFGVMKQNGLSSKYVPQLNVSGRIIHPGQCRKPTSSGGNCDHPWCGTPVLVTSPVGRTLADLVRAGQFGINEAIKCCHDCLSGLYAASQAGIRHGDIRPENVVFVNSSSEVVVGRQPYFVLIGWGHAILEERDRPAMNLHYSSTYALQEGKLCSASDSESLVYLLYFCLGADFPDLDSVEGALQWRETAWSKRLIQQQVGEISAVLKAFADYVDSLCGTPYPMDYDIWLRRLRRHIPEEDDEHHGKEIEYGH